LCQNQTGDLTMRLAANKRAFSAAAMMATRPAGTQEERPTGHPARSNTWLCPVCRGAAGRM
jgi:hypothetical protein